MIDLNGAVVDFTHNEDRPGMEWIVRIVTSTAYTPFECGVQSQDLVGNSNI